MSDRHWGHHSMNQPSVFISCVSCEFRQTRTRVAAILARLGYTPVFQEIFGTEPGDLRQVLRDKIDACEGLIQIVGQGYGPEPPMVDAKYGRVSYTQFEFLYAREKRKKTWLLFAGDACTRDTPPPGLDLPNDTAYPEPATYQAERRALQVAYSDQQQKDGHLYHTATSDTDLELKVEGLRDELAELRRAFKLCRNKVLRAFAVGLVLLALVGAASGGSATASIGRSGGSAKRPATLRRRKSAPICLSPSNALARAPSPMRKTPRAGRNASAFDTPPKRPTPEASPGLMNWPQSGPRAS
jgi:Domain of unknown function (DUF4062)